MLKIENETLARLYIEEYVKDLGATIRAKETTKEAFEVTERRKRLTYRWTAQGDQIDCRWITRVRCNYLPR